MSDLKIIKEVKFNDEYIEENRNNIVEIKLLDVDNCFDTCYPCSHLIHFRLKDMKEDEWLESHCIVHADKLLEFCIIMDVNDRKHLFNYFRNEKFVKCTNVLNVFDKYFEKDKQLKIYEDEIFNLKKKIEELELPEGKDCYEEKEKFESMLPITEEEKKIHEYIKLFCDDYDKLGGYYRFGTCEDMVKVFGDSLLRNCKYIIDELRSYDNYDGMTYTMFEYFYEITKNREYLIKLLVLGGKDSFQYRKFMIDKDYIDNDRILEEYQKLYKEYESHKVYILGGEGYLKAKKHFDHILQCINHI